MTPLITRLSNSMRSITTKLSIYTLVPLTIFLTGVLVYSTYSNLQSLSEAHQKSRALISSIIQYGANEALTIGVVDQLDNITLSLIEQPELYRISITDNQGNIVFQRSNSSIKSAQQSISSSTTDIYAKSLADDIFEAIPQQDIHPEPLGQLMIEWDNSVLLGEQREFYIELSVFAGVLLVGLILQIRLIQQQILRPIRKLNEGIQHIHKGDYQHQIKIQEADEIADLAQQLNELAQKLEHNHIERSERESEIVLAHSEADVTRIRNLRLLRQFILEVQRPLRVSSQQLILLAQKNTNPALQAEIKITVGCVHTALDLINDMQMLYGNDLQNIPLAPYVCELGALLDRTLSTLQREQQQKQLQLKTSTSGDIFLLDSNIFFDGRRFKQIAHYLLRLAIDNCSDGRITFNTHIKEKSEEQLIVCFDVYDASPGLLPQELQQLENFFAGQGDELQVASYAKQDLIIFRNLTQALASDVRITSSELTGTRISCGFSIERHSQKHSLDHTSTSLNDIIFVGEGIHQRYLKELCFQSSLEIECYDKLYQLPAEIADKPKTIILDCTQLEESIIGAHQLKQSGLIKLMALNFSNQPIHEDICHMLFDAGFEQIINKPLSINDLTSQIIKDNNWQPNWLNNITPFDKNISTKANVK